jgi:hypothetical protein
MMSGRNRDRELEGGSRGARCVSCFGWEGGEVLELGQPEEATDWDVGRSGRIRRGRSGPIGRAGEVGRCTVPYCTVLPWVGVFRKAG